MDDKNFELEKSLSPLNVWALALGCIIGWGAFVMPGNIFLGKAGILGTAIAMTIASVVMIIISFNYDFMIKRYPFAGGEFTYAYKTFGKVHGFMCAWFLGLSYLSIVPLNATALALISRNIMNSIFQVGFHYNVVGYDVYMGEVALAVFALILFSYLSIKGVTFSGTIQTILVFVLVGGVFLLFIVALNKGGLDILNNSPMYYDQERKLTGILTVIAVAPWAFVGFDTIPQAAEEFKFSPSFTKVIMIVSIVFGGLVYVILNTISALFVPIEYNNWTTYIGNLKNLEGLNSLPTFNAAYILLGDIGLVIIGMAVLSAILSGIVGFYMATSRLLYSLAKEGLLNSWFGVIDEKFKTPKNAILFTMLISLVAPFFGRTALGWIVDMSSLGAAIGYGYTSAAAFVCAYREKIPYICITSSLGIIISICFMILLLVPIPMFNCSLSKESYFCLVIWIVLGCVFYKNK